MVLNFIHWLNRWQTIIGASIGGVMGFVGAWWVEHSASVRIRVTAAQNIVATLLCVQVSTRAIDKRLNESLTDKKFTKIEFVLQYLRREPISPPSFYSDITVVMPCCYQLTVGLAGIRVLWLSIDDAIRSIKTRIDIYEQTEQKINQTPYLDAKFDTVYDGVHSITEQADILMSLLQNNVISKFRLFNNIILTCTTWYKRIFHKSIV